MPSWLILSLWGSLSLFVVWVAAAERAARWWEERKLGRGISEHDRALADSYPEIPPAEIPR